MTADQQLQIWGGVECSVVRVGEDVRNQLEDTGHYWREGDIDLMTGLGLKTVRYPVLWEMVEKHRGQFDWRWTDKRLKKLRAQGVSPIAGLIHHGSGPLWNEVLDPEFPDRLAAYAGRVAERYPWITIYTPVNEPLTTARICGLYGLWHPHTRDEAVCFRITVAECRAIARAMNAIRKVTPDAVLVQTEDFGRIYATPPLQEQAAYENERRWLSIDLLTGRVGRSHPFYQRFLEAGIDPRHLAELEAEPCPPGIIGIDYYLTSDRVLDHRLDHHPGEPVGGNGRQAYVDLAAVRSDVPQVAAGLSGRILEVWERYGLPIAVTELHNGCTRDEHLRWLMEGWHVAQDLRGRGVDLRAVTSWSLFGACDWNSMLSRKDGYYECGAFDSRYSPPRPTAVAHAISELSRCGHFDHPALDRRGWWHRNDKPECDHSRPLVLMGFGRMASHIEESCSRRRLRVVPSGKSSDPASIFDQHRAWALLRIDRHSAERGQQDQIERLQCQFADGEMLSLELPPDMSWHHFADTFLDMVVDRRIGRLTCVRPPHSTVMNALFEAVPDGDTDDLQKGSAA